MSQPPRDNRFLALRAAGQDATDFELPDEKLARFIELRDSGGDPGSIALDLGLDPEVIEQLVAADEAYAVAHRIATGQEPMYPPPAPGERVIDERAGSIVVPIAILIAVLVAVIVYLLLR